MAGNKVVLEFAGDATKLAKESDKATKSVKDFGDQAESTSKQTKDATDTNGKFLDTASKMGSIVDGATTAFDNISKAVGDFNDVISQASVKAADHARKLQGVYEAQDAINQATRDGKVAVNDAGQADIDLATAKLNATDAHAAYNKEVKKSGPNSEAAARAFLTYRQALQDVKVAQEDKTQAALDGTKATHDGTTATQDLKDANKELNPPAFKKWADDAAPYLTFLGDVAPLMLAAALAQDALNLSFLLSPITWIVLAVVALIVIIVLIATKTKWFQEAWKASWKWIKKAAGDVWDWIKGIPKSLSGIFGKLASGIKNAFKTAFNWVADAWNNTIGSLSWTIPGWIPGIGGKTISVPHIPKYHSGVDSVPGSPGSEMLAVLQAGERVIPTGQNSGSDMIHTVVMVDSNTIIEAITKGVRGRGGKVQKVLGGRNA